MIDILLVEDDLHLAFVLQSFLEDKGMRVTHIKDGAEAEVTLQSHFFPVCILDIMLPQKDGFELASFIKQQHPESRILFLTAKNQKADILKGFETGADDYLVKPFDPDILFLKINALQTRFPLPSSPIATRFTIGKLSFDCITRELSGNGITQQLSPKESQLLELFCLSPEMTIQRSDALVKIWKDDTYFNSRSFDVFLVRLKKKLKADPQIQIINLFDKGFRLFTLNTLNNQSVQ